MGCGSSASVAVARVECTPPAKSTPVVSIDSRFTDLTDKHRSFGTKGCGTSASVAVSPIESVPAKFVPVVPKDSRSQFKHNYELLDKIGKGSYAEVYNARSQINRGVKVAVKVRPLSCGQSNESKDHKIRKSTYKEVCLWKHVGRHPNCVHVLEHFFGDHLCYMVMELCSTTLIRHLDHCAMNGRYSERSLATVFTQMLQGLCHIHSVNISHRDLKLDNYLIGKDGCTIKLTDFGLSAYVPPGGKVDGICGTAPYICPEMLQTEASDLKADVWSFGVIAYLLLCGTFPYVSADGRTASILTAITKGSPVRCTRSWLSMSACELLAAMLNRDPESRSTAEFVLSMRFFTSSFGNSDSDFPDLQRLYFKAAATGAFVSLDLAPSTDVDRLLKYETNACKVLTQSHMDEFVTASPEKMDQLVQEFWSPFGFEKKAQETLSNASTCVGSSTSSIATNCRRIFCP